MKLQNDSRFEAFLMRIPLEAGVAAGLIVKATYDLSPQGNLVPAREPMLLVPQVLETPFGIIHGEYYFKKQGIDICVLGTVRRSRPVTVADVRLDIGNRAWQLRVTGNRRWVRRADGKLIPSSPEPFLSMPLGYEHAFGGEIRSGELSAPYSDNPKGRGRYGTEDEALHQLLPNIENPRKESFEIWREGAGHVAGFGPYANFWGLRASTAVATEQDPPRVAGVHPSLFNHAHPDLVIDALETGSEARLDGLHEAPIRFAVPPPPARVIVTVGASSFEAAAPIDGIFIWADEGKVVITQRARFQYQIHPEELRNVEVRPSFN